MALSNNLQRIGGLQARNNSTSTGSTQRTTNRIRNSEFGSSNVGQLALEMCRASITATDAAEMLPKGFYLSRNTIRPLVKS